jgi:hypothetical protein
LVYEEGEEGRGKREEQEDAYLLGLTELLEVPSFFPLR